MLGASAAYFAILGLLGGPIEGDASESVYSTWAIAHGDFACAYPPIVNHGLNALAQPFAATAPVYPLVSGVIAAVLRIGHAVPFPGHGALGPGCRGAVVSIFHWSVHASAIVTTVRVGYVVWPFLVAGALALVRASGRGRSWWEPAAALLLALAAPAWLPLVEFFHPQDILAVAFILASVAAALRGRWGWCGVLVGLAVATQQFALLAAAPLLVVVAPSGRRRFLVGALAATAAIDLPFVVATSGRAVHAILTGSSRAGGHNTSYGGSVLWELHLHGPALFVVARLAPIAGAGAIAWVAQRRLGDAVRDPLPLTSIVATSLALRLVFEENLFGYYFMAVAVALVMLDIVGGRVRGTTWAWIGLVTLAFNPVDPGFYSNWTTWGPGLYRAVPILILALGALAAVVCAARRRYPAYLYAWIVVAALAGETRLWGRASALVPMEHWAWQVVLVPAAVALCAVPLWREVKSRRAAPDASPAAAP